MSCSGSHYTSKTCAALQDTGCVSHLIIHIRQEILTYGRLELSRQTGSEPALTGLLRVFKNYYPEIIVGTAIRGRAAAFKHPDPSWRERLDEIQEDHRSKAQLDDARTRNGFRVNHLLGKQMTGQKSKLPGVHTLHAQENSITLEEVDSADSFVRNLEKIELPSQLVAVLADPLLQKLMILRPDNEASLRVSNWINACIMDVRTGDADASVLLDVIEVLQDYVSATKVSTVTPDLLVS
jgi:centromere protein I